MSYTACYGSSSMADNSCVTHAITLNQSEQWDVVLGTAWPYDWGHLDYTTALFFSILLAVLCLRFAGAADKMHSWFVSKGRMISRKAERLYDASP